MVMGREIPIYKKKTQEKKNFSPLHSFQDDFFRGEIEKKEMKKTGRSTCLQDTNSILH